MDMSGVSSFFFTIVEFKMETLLWIASDLLKLKLTEEISTLMQRHGQRKSRVGLISSIIREFSLSFRGHTPMLAPMPSK